jgi:hypothetical protein
MAYEGVPLKVRAAVDARDGGRCRWCGATNRGRDQHHIEYRRGNSYDVLENLVSLDRDCHSFVHGNPRPNGTRITKEIAQLVLFWVIEHPGTTGSGRWRGLKREFLQHGLCAHGRKIDECPYEHSSSGKR